MDDSVLCFFSSSLPVLKAQNYSVDTVEEGNDLDTVMNRYVELKSENPVEGQPNPTVTESESTREVGNKLDINRSATDDCKEPNFELSLKRLRGVQDIAKPVQDDRYVLRRSEQSAFSRSEKHR